VNKLTADHALDVADLLSPINQPMADVSDEWHQRKEPQGWLMRISEASYDAWRKNGSHGYGL
tara:strand:- start:44 stop:229 length:186 start_codon:yes stop_codon:yes gene_type:complete